MTTSAARTRRLTAIAAGAAIALLGFASAEPATAAKATTGYQLYFSGSSTNANTQPLGGALLAGGGVDVGMSWLLVQGGTRSAGKYGDVVVLRTTGSSDYNKLLIGLGANSVSTFVISSRAGANSAAVKAAIDKAEVVFIAGGDQSTYVNLWSGTTLQSAVNARIAAGYPIGGISAGLAVLGQYVYSALYASAVSSTTLLNPYDVNITLAPALFTVPVLANVITDSHFVVRDRMGRLVTFLARLQADGLATRPVGIGVDEGSGVAITSNGAATVIGAGRAPGQGAYILTAPSNLTLPLSSPLAYGPVTTVHVPVGGLFSGLPTSPGYTLTATGGALTSTQAGGSIY